MLEVRNLKKVYKTKDGTEVFALDGVSLTFGETGLVFLLGKSGSGKSTLLNICGGLDAPTEGEIIVKGRSSKDFSQSDFDSYRNTFVGFIFQEYNILNEFSVEDNVALALELQGRPKNKDAINALLAEVDLVGFAKRKPNQMSGGQKQRIAIARALVKSPQIIMADEPTGALDSNTGRQVFETLKKLSQDKLVIVVSHDREFAETYGDRIIELKDGKVISDVTKGKEPQQTLSANVQSLGDVLCVKSGDALTDADFEQIKVFLKGSKEDIIIANGEKDVAAFKKVSRIDDSGAKEVFRDTAPDTDRKTYSKEDSRFIRSKLPLRHAAKIGVSGLRRKPVRLIITVLLCTVAFALFGLLSTLNFYKREATFKQSLRDGDVPLLSLTQEFSYHTKWYYGGQMENEYDTRSQTLFTPAQLKDLQETLNADAFGAVAFNANLSAQKNSSYWIPQVGSAAFVPADNALRSKITGEYPDKVDEIAVSSYLAQALVELGTFDSEGNILSPSNAQELIGKTLTFGRNAYTVVGIFDSGTVPATYDGLKDESQQTNALLKYQYQTYLESSLHGIAFLSEDAVSDMNNGGVYMSGIHNYTYAALTLADGGSYVFDENPSMLSYTTAATLKKPVYTFADGKATLQSGAVTVADNAAILPLDVFAELLSERYYAMIEALGENREAAEPYHATMNTLNVLQMGGRYSRDEETGEETFTALTDAEVDALLPTVLSAAARDNIPLTVGVKPFSYATYTPVGELTELTVAGVYRRGENEYELGLGLSDATFAVLWEAQKPFLDSYEESSTRYEMPDDAIYNTVFLPFVYDEATIDSYWALYENDAFDENDTRMTLGSGPVDTLHTVDDLVDDLSDVFLYVGLAMAAFAALLFSNFISTSISYKKRDIGILRAVGARGADVFKIFFSESFVIAAICVVLSAVGGLVVCNLLNAEFTEALGAAVFVFGPLSFAVLFGVAIITAVIATYLPVRAAARKKPVDSIRAL